MKKILALVFAFAAMGQVNANAPEPHSPVGMSVVKTGSVVKLFYRGEQAGTVKVTIYNEKGEKVFTESMKNTENFMRPYNFSSLPEGNYTIELRDEQGISVKEVSYTRPAPKRVAHLTRLGREEGKYMLAVRNSGRESLTIRIYGAGNQLLHKETEVVAGDFAKVYNLHSVTGEHVFEIVDRKGNVTRLSKSLN